MVLEKKKEVVWGGGGKNANSKRYNEKLGKRSARPNSGHWEGNSKELNGGHRLFDDLKEGRQ